MLEPDLSVTVPEKLPIACPNASGEKHSAVMQAVRTKRILLLIMHTPFLEPWTQGKRAAEIKSSTLLTPIPGLKHPGIAANRIKMTASESSRSPRRLERRFEYGEKY